MNAPRKPLKTCDVCGKRNWSGLIKCNRYGCETLPEMCAKCHFAHLVFHSEYRLVKRGAGD